jgi:hypothetical protein
MNRASRRSLLMMLGAAAVGPALASSRAAATAMGGGVLIAPPAGTMRFRRSVIRNLAGGARIAVSREFEIGFRHFADGFQVSGVQRGVEVDAPAALAEFAELERRRVENKMFPILLDPFGQIIAEEPVGTMATEVDRAFNDALAMISRQPVAPDEREELYRFVTSLHQTANALTSVMPYDLFAPAVPTREEQHEVPLPTGDVGRVVSRFDADRDDRTGLMRRALREVVTEIEADRRQTVEHWQLDPA